jgi:hypothetical protein
MGANLTYEQARLILTHRDSRWFVQTTDQDRRDGHRSRCILKGAEPNYAIVRPFNHKHDVRVPWAHVYDWPGKNGRPAPPPPVIRPLHLSNPSLLAIPPCSSAVDLHHGPPSPEPLMPEPEPKPVQRNVLNRPLARKAEDALLSLSKEPGFLTMSRPAIADHIASKIGVPVTPGNLKTMAEAVEVVLPDSRTPSGSALSEIRLTRIEDAITFLLRNFGWPTSADTLRQLEIVRASWLSHLSAHRTPEE